MYLIKTKREHTIDKSIFILIIGLILTRITQIRILPGFGIGEILIICWIINNLLIYKKNNDYNLTLDVFTKFLFSFAACLTVGFGISWIRGINISPIFDILAFSLIIVFVIFLTKYYQRQSLTSILTIIELNFIIGSIFFGSIYIISLFMPSIFSINLWYGGTRFSAGANNPHQLVYYVLPQIFMGVFLIIKNNTRKYKNYVFIVLTIINIIIGFETESDTLKVSWLAGILMCILISILYKLNNKIFKIIMVLFIMAVATLSISIFRDKISTEIYTFFMEKDMGGSRITLWKTGIVAWMDSLLVGLGPGPHSGFNGPHNLFECHNTYIEVLTASGIIGFCLYLNLICKSIKVSLKNPIFIGILFSYLVYQIAGYSLRHIPFWFYIITIYYYNKKSLLNEC